MSIPVTQEAVMGQTIPRQHPAVVLRSHYRNVRALLAIAMIAVAILAATVVVLATDDDAPGAATATPSVRMESISSQTAERRAAVQGKATPVQGDTRFDGGPNEGTRGPGH
jgi:hypothetical protein